MAMVLLAAVLAAGTPLPQSWAVQHAAPATTSAAQIRLLENGRFVGGGTLVDRNWVLTSAHLFENPDNPGLYTFRFGVVTNQDDGNDTSNLRTIDRIVAHPQGADVAMVHFADPVPEGTWIPSLATQAPDRYAIARLYGWGPDGNRLNRAITLVIDPVATQNAEIQRNDYAEFATDFPPNVQPMVVNAFTDHGDSGGGLFTSNNILTGIAAAFFDYYPVNDTGGIIGSMTEAAYEQPVWEYRDWIMRTISGEGPSNPPPNSELKRRRLTEKADGDLPMTMPPQIDVCDGGEASCTKPEPRWAQGALLGSGNYRGTALAVCPQVPGNTCSFDGTTYAGEAVGRLPLGTSAAPGAGPRKVMVWCTSTAAFADDAKPQPALRVSFTNGDQEKVPVGMGWWDVTPDQVGTGTGQTPLDTTPLTPC